MPSFVTSNFALPASVGHNTHVVMWWQYASFAVYWVTLVTKFKN